MTNLVVLSSCSVDDSENDVGFNELTKFGVVEMTFKEQDQIIYHLQITNYSFNDVTNELKFTFSVTVHGANNDSDNDMTLAGNVNVAVLEEI